MSGLPLSSAERPLGERDSAEHRQCCTPEDIIEQLHHRVGNAHRVRNERRAERHHWITDLTLVIEDPLGKPRTIEVTTNDISAGGFSFVYHQFIHFGTKVRAHFESVPGRPNLDGVVRSCAHLGGMNHRVGVQFTSSQKDNENDASAKLEGPSES